MPSMTKFRDFWKKRRKGANEPNQIQNNGSGNCTSRPSLAQITSDKSNISSAAVPTQITQNEIDTGDLHDFNKSEPAQSDCNTLLQGSAQIRASTSFSIQVTTLSTGAVPALGNIEHRTVPTSSDFIVATGGESPLSAPQKPPSAVPSPPTHIFNIPSDIMLCILDLLDYPSTILLRLTCKKFNNSIPIPSAPPSKEEQLAMLQLFPPRPYEGDRSSPYLCKDCMMWHTFEHMIIFPDHLPEAVFKNYEEFTSRGPRVCVRFALLSGRWRPGARIDSDHVLCRKCLTPKHVATRVCSWNCLRCRTCVDRKGWSRMCRRCWRPGDREVMAGKEKEGEKATERICALCLGRLGYDGGPNEMCLCMDNSRMAV